THLWYARGQAECEARAAKRALMPGFRRRQSHGPFPRLPAYKMQANIRSRNLSLIDPVGIAPGELTPGVRHRGLPNAFNVNDKPADQPRAYKTVKTKTPGGSNPGVRVVVLQRGDDGVGHLGGAGGLALVAVGAEVVGDLLA